MKPCISLKQGLRCAEVFLQNLGRKTSGGKTLAGVLVDLDGATGDLAITLLLAWRRSFDNTFLIVRSDASDVIAAMRLMELPFGLLLDAGDGILPVRRQLAQNHLQNVWQKAPVFLKAKDCPDDTKAIGRAMDGWHVSAADVPGAVPGALLVRRVTYPKALTAGGAFPVRLWLENVGNAPVYISSRFQLRLKAAQDSRIVSLALCPPVWPVGDTVYNEIAQLPGVAPGEYTLACRVQSEDGSAVCFYGAESCEDGWLTLENIVLDDVARPELYSAWDSYYPDGYYPLEDPKLPE